jgi:hypothetical protein
LGWFTLLLMFELETYTLDDDAWTGWVEYTVRGLRWLCYLMIAHNVYALMVAVSGLSATVPVEDVADLCAMSESNVSYVYNLEYTPITLQNCTTLSDASRYYWIAGGPVISDIDGLELERRFAWLDLGEAIVWLLVIATIELVVRLQGDGIAGGAIVSVTGKLKLVLYLCLIAAGIYWASYSHWLYLWDELVWILGFAAIEMNVSEWRNELLSGANDDVDTTSSR